MFRRNWKEGSTPARQGHYFVVVAGRDQPALAQWTERAEVRKGKTWWEFVSDVPTEEKQPKELTLAVVRYSMATPEEVKNALKRELTLQEKIEACYKNFTNSFPRQRPNVAPPANRQVKPGQRIEVGNLREPVVLETRDDGAVVIFQHGGALYHEATGKVDIMATDWTNAFPILEATPERLTKENKLFDSFRNMHLESVLNEALSGFDDSPDYQRGYAWTEADQQKFLTSWMHGQDLGRIVLVKRKFPHHTQVLDGKQRLNTMVKFYCSEIAWNGIYFHELHRRDRNELLSRIVPVAYLSEEGMSRAELLEAFLNVNVAGVPQTEEHLAHVKALLEQERKKELEASSPR